MSEVRYISLSQIRSNPYQPRVNFDQESLDELAASIHQNGVIQPIVVRQSDPDYYEIIAGERRFKALQMLQWYAAPCIIMDANDQQMAQLALIENIQRDELTPVEEANAYKQILRMNHMTQQQLADKVGKSQAAVANKLRLLGLSPEVQQALNERKITERHGRAMLNLDSEQQNQVLDKIIEKNMTVLDTEKYIEKNFTVKKKRRDAVKCYGVSTRIAINTIRQAVKSLKNAGMPVEETESETDDTYTITINIKK